MAQRAQVAPVFVNSLRVNFYKFATNVSFDSTVNVHILESKGQCNLILGKQHSSGMPSRIFIKSDTNLPSCLRMN